MASFNEPADRTLISAAFAVAAAPTEFKTSAIIINDNFVTESPPIEFAGFEMPILLAVDAAGKSHTASRQRYFCVCLKYLKSGGA
jgi:hypothetical protein